MISIVADGNRIVRSKRARTFVSRALRGELDTRRTGVHAAFHTQAVNQRCVTLRQNAALATLRPGARRFGSQAIRKSRTIRAAFSIAVASPEFFCS